MKIKKILKKTISKRVVVITLAITVLTLGLGLTSYSVFFQTNETTPEVIEFGDLSVTYESGSPTINRLSDYPVTDAEAMNLTPFKFVVKNNGSLPEEYSVLLEDDSEYINSNSLIKGNDQYLKYKIAGSNGRVESLNEKVLIKGAIHPGEEVTHNLYLWVSNDILNSEQGKSYVKKITIKGEYKPNLTGFITKKECFAFNTSTKTITDYYDYESNNSSNPACPRDVGIPNMINDVEVQKIGMSSFTNKQITSVTFPNTLTEIASYSFQNNNISNVIVPEGVTLLGGYVFAGNQVTFASIPSTLITFNPRSFYKDSTSNPNLSKIITKSSRSFNWGQIINGATGYNFVTGNVENAYGDVLVASS